MSYLRLLTVKDELVALVLVKLLHEPFFAFRTENRISESGISELHIKQADIGDLKRGIVQINLVANLIRNTGQSLGCFHFLDRLGRFHNGKITGVQVSFKYRAVDAHRVLFGNAAATRW